MYGYIISKMDFDTEVIDIFLCIENGNETIESWIKGFDDTEWPEAEKFANELATALNIIYVGELA